MTLGKWSSVSVRREGKTYPSIHPPRRYNPCRVLADSNHLQPSLSLALILQFPTPSFFASLVTPSIHLKFGLPTHLLPSGLSKVIFLHGYSDYTIGNTSEEMGVPILTGARTLSCFHNVQTSSNVSNS